MNKSMVQKINSKSQRGYGMKVLGIDTSTASLSIALTVDGVLKYELIQNHALTHSERLLPYLEQMMKSVEFSLDDIDRIACTVGPGSFTGIRIGVSVANAFSMSLGKPVIGISTLEAMAFSHRFSKNTIVSTTDAQREHFYVAFYQANEGNELISLGKEEVLSKTDILQRCKKYENVIITGDAVSMWKDLPQEIQKAPSDMCYPRAVSVCLLAERQGIQETKYIEPVYLRKSQAELQFEERQGKQ